MFPNVWSVASLSTGVRRMGIYFLAFVVLLTFAYLGYVLFKPEKF